MKRHQSWTWLWQQSLYFFALFDVFGAGEHIVAKQSELHRLLHMETSRRTVFQKTALWTFFSHLTGLRLVMWNRSMRVECTFNSHCHECALNAYSNRLKCEKALTMEEKENVPPAKKRRLSLSLKKNRFQRVSEEEVSLAQKGYVPNNTLRCNNWAVNNRNSSFFEHTF